MPDDVDPKEALAALERLREKVRSGHASDVDLVLIAMYDGQAVRNEQLRNLGVAAFNS